MTPGENVTVGSVTCRPLRLLGRGKGGYSYLALTDAGMPVVLKQIHHEPCDYYTFGDKFASELHDYETLRRIGLPMPALLGCDRTAERIVKEYVPGPTVFTLVEQDALTPEARRQLEVMCRVLYANGLNIDYFPTNFIWCDNKLYYIDYECNAYDAAWDFANWGCRYWARTPEFLEHAARLHEEAVKLGLDDPGLV